MGEFSQDRYTQLLRLNSYSPAGYELAQSKSLTREQIKRNLSGSAFMSSIQIDQLNDLASQQREVSYIVLNTNIIWIKSVFLRIKFQIILTKIDQVSLRVERSRWTLSS